VLLCALRHWLHLQIGAVSVYGGYFGAGSGVMLLAALLLLVDSRVPPANAIKNVLLGAISLAAARGVHGYSTRAVERCPSAGRWATGRQLDRPHHCPPRTTEPRTVGGLVPALGHRRRNPKTAPEILRQRRGHRRPAS
jgi:hypothetical protein